MSTTTTPYSLAGIAASVETPDTASVNLQSATLSYFPPAGVNAVLNPAEAVLVRHVPSGARWFWIGIASLVFGVVAGIVAIVKD